MMKPTVHLKFVNGVLQQQWIDDDPADESGIKYVWRDVPSENTAPRTDRSVGHDLPFHGETMAGMNSLTIRSAAIRGNRDEAMRTPPNPERIAYDALMCSKEAYRAEADLLKRQLIFLKELAANAVREYPVASGIYVDSDGQAGYGSLREMRLYLGIPSETAPSLSSQVRSPTGDSNNAR